MIVTVPVSRAAAALVMIMDLEVNLVAAVAMVPVVLASNKMMNMGLEVNWVAAVAMVLAASKVTNIVPEPLAVAQVIAMVQEPLAVAPAMITDPVVPVAMAQAISLEVASVVAPTRTLVVGQAMMTTTIRRVRKPLWSYFQPIRTPGLTFDRHAESTKDKILGKVEGVLGRNKKDNDESSGGYGGNNNNY